MLSYDSFMLVAWATGADQIMLSLCRTTAFKGNFEEFLNIHQYVLTWQVFPDKSIT